MIRLISGMVWVCSGAEFSLFCVMVIVVIVSVLFSAGSIISVGLLVSGMLHVSVQSVVNW